MALKNLVESQQLSKDLLFDLFQTADHIRRHPQNYSHCLDGKLMITMFYEPSTRTRLSFESAMLRLGGKVTGTENAREFSSAAKGESIEDSTRIIGSYADCIVMRHYEEGAANRAASVSPVPVINAGDGKGQHPTQALLDLYTIQRESRGIDGTKIAMVGDLANGRTVRSLCYLLGKFEGVEVVFVSPENLRVGQDIKDYLKRHRVSCREEGDLDKVLPEVSFVYMTRIQKERMSPEDYEMAKGKFVINERRLHAMRSSDRLMHPLPHVEEIDLPVEVEQKDPKVAYFRQAENGLYARMALLLHLMDPSYIRDDKK